MLTVHRAERADALVGPLAELLATAPEDPFEPDVIAVPTRGVERWLAQQLALTLGADGARDGIAANIRFPSPATLVDEVLAFAAGLSAAEDPWIGERLAWNVLAVLDASAGEPWRAIIDHHLGVGSPPGSYRHGRRYSTAATVARLFISYSDNRPAMLSDWAQGRDTDGAGGDLPADMAWQPMLWRRVREHLGTPSPAERLAGACERLVANPALVGLPQRLSVFGPTRLSRSHLDVLQALAAGRDLHLWLTHPSPGMWDKLASEPRAQRRRDHNTAMVVDNPLLISLSRDVRELQQRLPPDRVDVHHPPVTTTGATVLARIQDDICADVASRSHPPVLHDGSVTIHGGHGPARQVEVLRESLLHLLNDDPTLQPRDVIVLCPDVDTFAPLLAAAFGPLDAPHPGHRLRVRLADRSPGRTNPLLDIAATLLRLADGRITATEVLDLAGRGPVARRFSFAHDDLDTLRQWSTEAGARWGLTQSERELFGLDAVRQNTFARARDRILLGVTAADSGLAWLGDALPLGEVTSSDVDLAGRFAEYLQRLEDTMAALRGPQAAPAWAGALETALDQLTDPGDAYAWQRTQASRRIAEATGHAGAPPLSLSDVRAALAWVLRPVATRANFRTGEITVAGLMPMRFVPHRVIAVIGLDDELFPRVGKTSGDDILAAEPWVGERDPRSEDRQLFLDAVMSATEHLILCYTGADPVTGEPRPPVAPLADVIDTVTATVGKTASVVTEQPLQPFDSANFVAPEPFSFDAQAFAGAVETTAERRSWPVFLPAPLDPAPADDEVSLDDVVELFVHPTKAFLRQRLGVAMPGNPVESSDQLPVALTGLERWAIGDRMLHAVLAHAARGDVPDAVINDVVQAELRRGTLPPGQLGEDLVADIANAVAVIVRIAGRDRADHESSSVDVSFTLGRYRVSGTVPDVYGSRVISATYSVLEAKQRLAAWIRLLALACSGGSDWQAITIGRLRDDFTLAKRSLLKTPPDPAAILTELLELRSVGLRAPLPLVMDTSYSYAETRTGSTNPDDAYAKAVGAWTSTGGGSYRVSKDNDDDAIVCVYGSDAPFSVVWDQPSPDGQRGIAGEPSWFAQLAVRLWSPLLRREYVLGVK